MRFEFPSRANQLRYASNEAERDALLEQRDIELEDYLAAQPSLGSNADGEWAKFPSGLLICWFVGTKSLAISSAYGALFVGQLSFTFPYEFIAQPVVSPGRSQYATGAAWAGVAGVTTTTCAIYFIDAVTRAAADTTVSYLAVGRWK
jgi:hypothetical protein